MRNVLSNHQEVAHFWANRKQESGKSGNMYFSGKVIYSYGEHFPIARHEDLNTILFTTRSYSTSTSKHISYTRRAIPADKKIIYVADVKDINWHWKKIPYESESDKEYYPVISTIKDNLTAMEGTIIDTLKKAIRARFHKSAYLSSAQGDLDNMAAYLELRKKAIKASVQVDYKHFSAFVKNTRAGLADNSIQSAIALQVKAEQKAEKERQERIRKENAEKIEQWKNGASVYLPRLEYAILRINKEKGVIETSQSATVTIQEGKILWARIKANKPIIGQVLSGFTVLSFNGELKIGCHKIERSEVNRIGALLDAIE